MSRLMLRSEVLREVASDGLRRSIPNLKSQLPNQELPNPNCQPLTFHLSRSDTVAVRRSLHHWIFLAVQFSHFPQSGITLLTLIALWFRAVKILTGAGSPHLYPHLNIVNEKGPSFSPVHGAQRLNTNTLFNRSSEMWVKVRPEGPGMHHLVSQSPGEGATEAHIRRPTPLSPLQGSGVL